jgi:hypothetical protein
MNTLRIPQPVPADRSDRERRADDLRARRRHRWAMLACLAAAGLVAYVLGLGWFATRLADDLSTQIQPIPALEDQQHRAE